MFIKIIKKKFCKQKPGLNNIKENYTKIHDIFRFDGYNYLKNNEYAKKEIIKREKEIFKKWQNYLKEHYKEWESEVYSRTQLAQKDLGDKYGIYEYYNVAAKEGYDILMRKNDKGKQEVVLDLKTIPFLKDINNTILKTLRINKNHKKVAFVVDLENNEKYCGGIYNIESKTFSSEIFNNVASIEFSNNDNIVLYVQNDNRNRPYKIVSHIVNDKHFSNDKIIYEESDLNVYIETNPTKDHKYIVINALTKDDSKISIIDLNTSSDLTINTLFERKSGVKYFIEHSHVSL
jgi:protease II